MRRASSRPAAMRLGSPQDVNCLGGGAMLSMARSMTGTVQLTQRLRGWPLGYYAGFALGRCASIVVLPVVAHVAGPAGFGRFEVALAVMVATAIVFDAGMGAAVVRFWSDDRVERRSIV